MERMNARRGQRGFFAVGFALALLAGFGAAGWGIVELTEGDAQAVVAESPATETAQSGNDGR
jgi:hypothetical protein